MQGRIGGSRMADTRSHDLIAQALRPEEYAELIADDRHLAAQFGQFCSLGDTPDALQLAVDEAREILARCNCMPVSTALTTNQSLDDSKTSIDEIAVRSELRGDTVQAAWCRMLNHALRAAGP